LSTFRNALTVIDDINEAESLDNALTNVQVSSPLTRCTLTVSQRIVDEII